MRGYTSSTYGDAFADVYDEWYGDGAQPYSSPTASTVATLAQLANGGPVLELGVGTGRLAVPLAVAHGLAVTGVDSSGEMLRALAAKPGGRLVTAVLGDMAVDQPPGPFAVVVATANTLFNLDSAERQAIAIAEAARRLTRDGRLVLEGFLPSAVESGDQVSVRTLDADRVVLSVSRIDGVAQVSEQQLIEFTPSGLRLRPTRIRWSTPEQLDHMASAAGLEVEHRWADWDRTPIAGSSAHHVSVWRRVADFTDDSRQNPVRSA